jgi:hypothetical protein
MRRKQNGIKRKKETSTGTWRRALRPEANRKFARLLAEAIRDSVDIGRLTSGSGIRSPGNRSSNAS